ncbi:STM3941 family protein [Nitrospirillum sp. BR 11828]|uniref:STM3941 family protein n=1 Tax=Nitrospirillum sp. BR 11828 TaxID=3104325 RepID=UPI002ACA7889|nr:STM3941 family protein [Nitrospirillum sp. BR 11828]MDZ5646331.1 STM3941 family protein [Nitrospirillum sp. BR 11828]
MSMQDCPDLPVEFRTRKGELIALFLLAGVMTVGGYFLFIHPDLFVSNDGTLDDSHLVTRFIGLANMAICGLFMGWEVRALIKRMPRLTFTSEGIIFRTGALVRWTDIRNISVHKSEGSRYVAIQLRNEEAYYAALHPLPALWALLNAHLMGAPINISTVLLGVDANAMATWITHYVAEAHLTARTPPTQAQ